LYGFSSSSLEKQMTDLEDIVAADAAQLRHRLVKGVDVA
jgi:hypothetical protein